MTQTFPPFQEEPITRSVGIAYVIFARPLLDKTTDFLSDFGIDLLSSTEDHACFGNVARNEVFYVVRREPKARFVGLAMYVASEEDLHRFVAEGMAQRIESTPAPNGQPYVRMTDPSGFEVHAVVQGPNLRGNGAGAPAGLVVPNAPHRHVRIDSPVPPPAGVPRVQRLGHVVMETIDFSGVIAWYQRAFGMLVSDYQHLPDGMPVVAFCRCDLGDEPTDHHTIAIGRTFRVSFEHVAFELEDIEAVTRGQHRLREKGHKHSWGVGRHIMGSQVFDYWYDRLGTKHEHYADGDMVTSSYPMGKSPFGPAHLAQWGPPMPADFVGGKLSPKVLVDLVRCAASGGLPVPTIVSLIKAVKFSDRRIGTEPTDGEQHATR